MRRKFEYEYEDTSPDTIRFDYSGDGEERLEAWVGSDGSVNLAVNADGALVLARLLIQYAQCDFSKHFHVHVHKDFDADESEILMLVKLQE